MGVITLDRTKRLPCPSCGSKDTLQEVRADIEDQREEGRGAPPLSDSEFRGQFGECEPHFEGIRAGHYHPHLLTRQPGKAHPRTHSDGITEDQVRFYWETCGKCGTFFHPFADQVLAELKRARQRWHVKLGHAVDAMAGLVEDEEP